AGGVARHGRSFAEGRRDRTWALLRGHDLDRLDAEDPEHPGIVLDTPERREIAQFSEAFERNRDLTRGWWMPWWDIFESRRAVLETVALSSLHTPSVQAHIFWAGAYRDALPLMERSADAALESGELALAPGFVALCARVRMALGDLALAERDLVRLTELLERAGNPPWIVGMRDRVLGAVFYCRGTGL